MDRVYKEIFVALINVRRGQFYLGSDFPEKYYPCEKHFRGQNNRLCGAAFPGCLLFTASPKDSVIPIEIHLCDTKPKVKSKYTDIVEVSFRRPEEGNVVLWAHEERHSLYISNGDYSLYRVRYSIVGLDNQYDYMDEGAYTDEGDFFDPVSGQKYLIEMWPEF